MRLALVIFFALEAVSASLALGLPFFLAWFERRRSPAARDLVTLCLVNQSAAVVLGVAGLLFLTVLHPQAFVSGIVAFFYPVMGILPLLSIAFASMYAYQMKGWRPGPILCGLAILAIAAVFTTMTARGSAAATAVRLAPFAALSLVSAGVAVMIVFSGQETARTGAWCAWIGSWALAAAAVAAYVFMSGADRYAVRNGVLPALVGLAVLIVALGVLVFARRVTRPSAILVGVGVFLVSLTLAVLREAVR